MDIDIQRLKVDADYWDECGAPEDATHYSVCEDLVSPWHKVIGSTVSYFVEDSKKWLSYCGPSAPQLAMKNAISRPTKKSQEWDGERRPPVGCECEYRAKGGSLNNGPYIDWRRCRILAVTKFYVIMRLLEPSVSSDHECSVLLSRADFRPLRTPEQRERESLLNIAHEAAKNAKLTESSIEAIIDAILDKCDVKEKR